ncbi:MAG: TonB-dependent receptor, partial [Gemmatimonadota bacterium]
VKHWRSWMVSGSLFAFALLLGGARSASAQGSISGTVSDSGTGAAVAGAVIVVSGTRLNATSAVDGHYTIADVPAGSQTVQIRAIGYAAVQRGVLVTDGQAATADFSLRSRPIELDEIVATGYGNQNRGSLTTAISSVSGDQIHSQPTAGLDAALKGKMAGVEIDQNAGNPGNAISVRIRGVASLTANSQPLFVIDGVPMNSSDISQLGLGGQGINGVTGISPGDIETIDVLKDAAATAIYGSRGANGVVIITTKRGKAGKTEVTFDSYIGTQGASKRLPLMNAKQYLEFMNEAALNDGYDADYFGTPGVDDAVSTDWQDEVLRHAPIGNMQLAINGGSDNVRFRASGDYFGQQGIVIGSDYQRISSRINLDFSASNRLTFKTSLAVSGENNHRVEGDNTLDGVITNAVGESPLTPARLADGSYNTPDDGLNYDNPVAIANLNTTRARTLRVLGNVEARWQVLPSLAFTSRVGVDMTNLRETQYESALVAGSYAASAGGVAKSGYSTLNVYVFDNYLNFDKTWGRNVLGLTAGTSLEEGRGELNFVRGEGLGPLFTQVDNATIITVYGGNQYQNNLVSVFGRANYTLDGKYSVSGSIRTDASSRFGSGNRWGTFPGISAAWLLSEEPFFRSARLDNLKLRASYGLAGNQSISNYASKPTYCSANYGTTRGIAPCNLGNASLGWEHTKEFDVGVDLSLWQGRATMTADYYRKTTTDLLVNRPIPSTSGYTSVYSNVGGVLNKGLELVFTGDIIRPAMPTGFGANLALNVAFNKNRVTSLFQNQPFGEGDLNRVEVGHPIGEFYGYKFVGVDPATGDALFENAAGAHVTEADLTTADRKFIGSPYPNFTGGLTAGITYGRLDFKAFFEFSQGAKVLNSMRIYSGNGGYYTDNQFSDQLARWQNPGDVTDVPRASYDGTSGAELESSRFIEDGSYFRLQDLTLGWTLPLSWMKATGFHDARLYVSGHNLFTVSKYTGYNPDVNSTGNGSNVAIGTDFYAYPIARTFSFGVQAGW